MLDQVGLDYVKCEGYESVVEWREMINAFFASESAFDPRYSYSPDMKIWCMWFKVVKEL